MNRSRGGEFGRVPRPFVLLSTLSLGLLCVVLAGGAHPGDQSREKTNRGETSTAPDRADRGAPVAPARDGDGRTESPTSEPPLSEFPLPPALGQTPAGALLPLSPSGGGPALGPSGRRTPGAGPVPREPVPPDLWAASWPRPAAPPDPSLSGDSGEPGKNPGKKVAEESHPARAPPARG